MLTLAWGGLPVAEYQNGRAELSVQRNRRLLSDPIPGLPATIGARYGHPMATSGDAGDDLLAYVPVTLAPDAALTDAAADALDARLRRWEDDNRPAVVQGRTWAFALAVHSQLNPDDRQPLLSLGQLVYRITD